ncbi:hypothetical protein [uncultured Sphingomonas sp.]|uniref:hypothetical protein n=1 Tax=uncultured Sphingomonas sp. TaxID=158754 RepID=UPI0035C9CFE3
MRLTLWPVAAAMSLAGCAIPASHPQVRQAGGESLGLAAAPIAPAIAADWRHAFGDPQLDRIVADSLAGNPSLDVGLARVGQAQAMLSVQRSATGPQLTADVNPQVARFPASYLVPPPYAGTLLERMGMSATQAAGATSRQMVGQAYLLASTDLFALSSLLCAMLIVVVWFTRRPAPASGPVVAD